MKERVVTDYMIGTIRNTVHDYYLDKGYFYNDVRIEQVRDTAQKNPHTILTIEHQVTHNNTMLVVYSPLKSTYL